MSNDTEAEQRIRDVRSRSGSKKAGRKESIKSTGSGPAWKLRSFANQVEDNQPPPNQSPHRRCLAKLRPGRGKRRRGHSRGWPCIGRFGSGRPPHPRNPFGEQIEYRSSARLRYGATSMLGASGAYNCWSPGPLKPLIRRFDHSAIYLLIAATYTPFLLHIRDGTICATILIFV
jgi:hypothetical protein